MCMTTQVGSREDKGSVPKKVENIILKIPKRQKSRVLGEPPLYHTETFLWYTLPSSSQKSSLQTVLASKLRKDPINAIASLIPPSSHEKEAGKRSSRCNYARR